MSSGPQYVIHRGSQSSEIGRLLLDTSSDLAECKSEEIEEIIQQSIVAVSAIEHAEQAGWFSLGESGILTDIFHSPSYSLSLCSALRDGLHRLPWCLGQLNTGKAVLIYDVDDLLPAAKTDQQFLRAAEVRSLALLPSASVSLGRTVLILSSTSAEIEWSEGIVEQCKLLEGIFANAYQRGLAQNESRVCMNCFQRLASIGAMAILNGKGQFISVVSVEDLTGQRNRKTELNRRETEVGTLASLLIQSQESERKRLSRELHDDIGQRLSLAASELALLVSQQSINASVSVDRLASLRDELDSLCTDVHEISHDLHSYKLQHLGLKAALKDLSRRVSQPNFRVDLHIDDFEDPTSKDVSLCLYRVAQESLNNALKHARTPTVAVTITKLQNMFYMTIQDSGIGFDSSISSKGLGLVSMSERLKLVNGQFRLHSLPGRGTEIWVAVPDQPEPIAESIMPKVQVA